MIQTQTIQSRLCSCAEASTADTDQAPILECFRAATAGVGALDFSTSSGQEAKINLNSLP